MTTVPAATASLAKGIRFRQLFAIGFGTMIGVGWMLVAGSWILTAGPGGAMVAFGVGAAAVVVIALAYGEMGSCLPFSGGEIVYAFEGLGAGPAFIVGWLLALTGVSVCAFEAVASPWIVSILAPATAGPVLYHILGSDVTLGAVIIGACGLILLTWVNARGGLASARIQNYATWLKVGATSLFVIAALLHGSEANRLPWFTHDASGSVVGPIIAVLATVPVWYGGFNALPQALGEVADLRRIRSLAWVLASAILAGFTFFSLVILATASAAPRVALARSEFPVATALFSAFSSPWPGRLVLTAGLLGLITSWNASIFSGARVLLCMGRAHIIPGVFARVHPRYGSPAFAAIFIGTVSVPIALLGRNGLLPVINLVGLSYAVGYLCTTLALVRMRGTDPGLARPYRMPGHPLLTYGAVLIAATFVIVAAYNIWVTRKNAVPPEFVALGAWLGLGAIVWQLGRPARIGILDSERRALIRAR
jgi:basic amino acid/polyamine antiporter, APA family